MIRFAALLIFLLGVIAPHGLAQETITQGNRSVTFTKDVPRSSTGYDTPWAFSHAIRAGDFVYLSGMIIGVPSGMGKPLGANGFKDQTRDVFRALQKRAQSAGATLSGVVKINTYHVENPALTSLDKTQQARIIADVKKAYIPEPHPAWTAVGTPGLFAPNGLVEIEVVIYSPAAKD